MDNCFRIVTPVYNAGTWMKRCIDSVKNQTYTNFLHVIVDDCSTDDTLQIAYEETKGDDRFMVVQKDTREGVMHSHVTGVETLSETCDSEGIFVHLDGDDWLAHNKVLERVNEIYNERDCWLTYGNYAATDGTPSVCREVITSSPRREIIEGWPFSHLRTFKKFLWDKIKSESLNDSKGYNFTSACDVAIMIPMIEMAGDKASFIDEELYIYNRENPLNEDKDHLQDQVRCALEILNQKSYTPLNVEVR